MGIGGGQTGGKGSRGISEEELFLARDPLDELRRTVNVGDIPEAKRGEQQRENLEALLSIVPVVGNVISGKDAIYSGKDALDAFAAGDMKGGAINTGLTGLNAAGAVLGLPVGKAAKQAAKAGKDSVNVFVPSENDSAASIAREMRESGKSNPDVWKDTGRVFSAEGGLRRELSDSPLEVALAKLNTSEAVPLRDAVKHPELLERMPELGNIGVKKGGFLPTGEPLRTARTDAQGTLIMPDSEPTAKSNMAKLLQYTIGEQAGFAPAMRHGVDNMRNDLAGTASKAASARYETPKDLEALAGYLSRLDDMRTLLDRSSGSKFGSNLVTARSAGNVEAKQAQMRAGRSPEELARSYPYARNQSGAKRGAERPAAYEHLLPLLRLNASPEEVRANIANWYKLGSGRDAATEDLDALIARLK